MPPARPLRVPYKRMKLTSGSLPGPVRARRSPRVGTDATPGGSSKLPASAPAVGPFDVAGEAGQIVAGGEAE
jgi:hypothetical protein